MRAQKKIPPALTEGEGGRYNFLLTIHAADEWRKEVDMNNKNNGGSAFPHMIRNVSPDTYENLTHGGMTLRDYFAAKSAQSLKPPEDFVGERETNDSYSKWADKAYRMADALLKARG